MKKSKIKTFAILATLAIVAVVAFRFLMRPAANQRDSTESSPPATSANQAIRHDAEIRSIGAEIARLEQNTKSVRDLRNRNALPGYKYLELSMRSLVKPVIEELGLSDEQAARLVDIYSEFQEIRVRYEQDLVKQDTSQANQLAFTIPAYIEAGKHLRGLMENELVVTFGHEKAVAIQAKIGAEIEQKFLGFGVCEQRFTVKEVHDGPLTLLKVVRSAAVVPEAIPHLPLSIASFAGSGATAVFTLETLKTGEYSVVAPFIEQHLASGGRIPPNG